MSPEEMKARARRIPEEVFTQGDLAVADEVLATGFMLHVPCPARYGVEDLKGWALTLRRAFPDLSAIVEGEIAQRDTVMLRLTYRGTHTGIFLGLPPTGKRVSWQAMECLRLGPDGKVVEQWIVADLLSVLQQIGALPPVFSAPRCAVGAAEETNHRR
jgi:predicted ester cyclase